MMTIKIWPQHCRVKKTVLTSQNFKAVFGFMAENKHSYTLEAMYDVRDEDD